MEHNNVDISILVAYTKENRIIGAQGKIPWNLSSERNRFKEICKNKPVIMGRKSFEEIGKPLSYCTLVVVSKSLKKIPEGCLLADSLETAIELCTKNQSDKEILIAGGEEIYRQALPLAKTIYATEIHKEFPGDTYFPKLDTSWKKIETSQLFTENTITYEYLTYARE